MINIKYPGGNISVEPEKGLSLSQELFIRGFFQDSQLCSGLGKCGKCAVVFTKNAPAPLAQEEDRLGSEKIAAGHRLSCLHPALACDIELDHPPLSPEKMSLPDKKTGLALGLDLGTTSICWTDGSSGPGSMLNPQAGLGSEIMSRMAFARKHGGREILRDLVRVAMARIFTRMGSTPERVCVAGNSAQTYLLLGMDTTGLSAAPYRLNYRGGDLREILPGVEAYIPPLIAPFVGADLSAGLAWLMLEEKPAPPFILADLGTNGEFILVLDQDRVFATSIPMGPALEGAGLRLGSLAKPGAATGFSLTPNGLEPVTMGNKKWNKTITGTGYLSLASTLMTTGAMDRSGRFSLRAATPLGKRIAAKISTQGREPVMTLGPGAEVPASDFEEILKIKAAFNLALSTLLGASGLPVNQVEKLVLAGALGEHIKTGDLAGLGFIPQALENKTLPMGNTSLKGAFLLAKDDSAQRWIKNKAKTVEMCHPEQDDDFDRQFISRMVFNYVH